MFDKTNIKQHIKQKSDPYVATVRTYILSLRDVRNVGLLVFIVIVLLISWSGVKSIQTNYGLQKQVAELQQQNQVQSLENADQELQNQYYNTNQYFEVAARENFGLGAPGETELLISQSVALAHTVKEPGSTEGPSKVPKQPLWQRNIGTWMDFFLHRGTSAN